MRPTRTFAALALSLLVLASWAQEKGQDKAKKKPDEGARIKVAVEMVSLPVVVSTREAKLVTDLEKGDFLIFEDGVPQEIAGFSPTDEPISVALTIDTSGSTETRLAEMQNESIRFTELLHPDDSVAVLSFAEDVKLQKDFTIDRSVNARGIKQTRPGGSTVLYEAVWLALEEVLKPIQERKALVLFTDGVDTTSRKASQKETLELARETRAAIYSIYFNTEYDIGHRGMPGTRPTVGGIPLPGGGPTVMGPPIYGPGRGGSWGEYAAGRKYLEDLSEYSGGRVFDALAMQDLGPAFEQIARELASQYSIGYYSTNTKTDGKFRKVEVRVKRPGLVARTKKGYYSRKQGK